MGAFCRKLDSTRHKSGFTYKATADDVTEGIDASGVTAIVTGATSGIGREAARVLAKRGAHVFMAIRNLEAGAKVKEEFLNETPQAKVDLLKMDTSSLESVRTAAKDFLALNVPLNILICNAGVAFPKWGLSKDGIEMQFATNYLGHFLFTNILLDNMKETARSSGREGKIINVSSDGHRFFVYKGGIRFDKLNDKDSHNIHKDYGQSKLAQILSTKELARRLQEEGANVTVNALHPGWVDSNISAGAERDLLLLILKVIAVIFKGLLHVKTAAQGAAAITYLALNPKATGLTGKYFVDVEDNESPSEYVKDGYLAKKLWEFSEKLTAPK